VRRVLALLVLLGAILYAVGALLFLGYDDDPVRRADAVVVLAGGMERLPVAVELMDRRVAPLLVVSEDVTGKDVERGRLCRRGTLENGTLLCFAADPYSTRGEARFVSRLARERGWDRIVLVTTRYHLFRATRIFERCTEVELIARGAPTSVVTNVLAVPYEWAKLVLAGTARRGC
jgi:uncharacterized SAM-binding protein YcdF (DUF218 family)